MPHLTQLYIDGRWVDASNGGVFDTLNPATGEVIAAVASATAADIDLAVQAARACVDGPSWGLASTGAQRAAVLRRLGEVVAARQEELARLDALDQGKPLREARADVNDVLAACAHFAALAEGLDEEGPEGVDNGSNGDFTTTVVREPVGVVGAITPWNYPLLMGVWKVLPALAAGCAVVLKPSELAPLSCLVLAAMLAEAGLPAGALNVCPGLGPVAGAALAEHPNVDKLAFTGSAPTARRVMAAAATGPRAVSLELGGKSAMLVFPDADVDAAVDWALTGVMWGSGQVCSSTARVLVHVDVRAAFVEKLLARLPAIAVGDSLSAEMLARGDAPAMGPLVSAVQCEKVWGYIDDARAAGATVLHGGDRAEVAGVAGGKGFFVPPTVLADAPSDSRAWREEIFGPVLCLRDFRTEDEAVATANDSAYGLAAAVMSADAALCDRVARRLRVGVVWLNCSQPAFVQAPWGGVKQSGFGRDLGRWGLDEGLVVKQVTACASGFSWGLW